MELDFWELFWTTGMPEAWLLSRETGGAPLPGDAQGLASPQLTPTAAPAGEVPGSMKNIY